MELVVRKTELLRELQLFQSIVERKNTIPILANVLIDARRCCMNRHWPARCPPTEFLPADTIRRWSAKGGHPIQDLTAEDDLTPLPGWAPGAKTISDDGLVAEKRVLHSALTMVP